MWWITELLFVSLSLRIMSTVEEHFAKEGSFGRRQNVMLSATLSAGVEKLAGLALTDPEHVNMSEDGSVNQDQLVTPTNLKQWFLIVPPKLRLVTLAAFILWKCTVSPLFKSNYKKRALDRYPERGQTWAYVTYITWYFFALSHVSFVRLIQVSTEKKVLIFMTTQDSVDYHAELFNRVSYVVFSLFIFPYSYLLFFHSQL